MHSFPCTHTSISILYSSCSSKSTLSVEKGKLAVSLTLKSCEGCKNLMKQNEVNGYLLYKSLMPTYKMPSTVEFKVYLFKEFS